MVVQNRSLLSRAFDICNVFFLSAVSIICIIPFVHVLAGSFSPYSEIASRGLLLFPNEPTLEGYEFIVSSPTLPRSFLITLYITIAGTVISLGLTSLTAYPLSLPGLVGRRVMMFLVSFTLLFSGGIIPTYIVVRKLGLVNSLWSLMIPNAITSFNLIILRSFFLSIPRELSDSVKVDGGGHFLIFSRIVLPLSLPALATIGLFYAVAKWNIFFEALIYINDSRKWPLQILLRQIVIMADNSMLQSEMSGLRSIHLLIETIKYATVVVTTVPVLIAYPFIQRYFVTGLMIGSLKS